MTDETKRYIEAYIPSPRDERLGDFEYYVKDEADRIQRVEISEILPKDLYIVVQSNSRRRVHGWREFGAVSISDMYDNKEDCRNDTHLGINSWEDLRRKQKQEE